MVTAENITTEQLRSLQKALIGTAGVTITIWALSRPGSQINGETVTAGDIVAARRRCAEILNARAKRVTNTRSPSETKE